MTANNNLVPFEPERAKRKRREDDDGGGRRGGGGGGGGLEPRLADSPVQPLGHTDGKFYFFDPVGQFRSLTAQQLGQSPQLVALFGELGVEWLVSVFPQLDRDREPTGWFSVREAGKWLVARCLAAGILSSDEPKRGLGVWRGPGGLPVVHVGDSVLIRRGSADGAGTWETRRAGFRDFGALWPASAPTPPPAPPASAEDAAALEAQFARWNWRTPGGAGIFFGLYAAGLLAAAIGWRPHGLVVGPPGSGKSTLLEHYAAGSPLAVVVNDYTEAGLRQSMSSRAAPLILDEAEGEERGKLEQVIRLLRRASGGGGARVLRGSSGGEAQRFDVSSPALLGGVLPPALEPQDESRITRLDLAPRAPGGGGPGLPSEAERDELRRQAPALWGRALAGVARFAVNLAVIRAEILGRGCPPRLADQIGTILAARAMMRRDEPLTALEALDEADEFAALCRSEEELAAEQGPALCLAHLLQSATDMQEHGERPTVGELVRKAAGLDDAGIHARRVLVAHGIKLARLPMSAAEGPLWLYVANTHPRLSRLYADSRWSRARWKEDLRNLAGTVAPADPVWIGGAKVRALALSPEHIAGEPAPAPPAGGEPGPAPPFDGQEGRAVQGMTCGGGEGSSACYFFAPGPGKREGRCFGPSATVAERRRMRDYWCHDWRALTGVTDPPASPET